MGFRSEAEFLKAVIDLAKSKNIIFFHDYDSRKNPKGLPDLILLSSHHLIWRELKLEGGHPEGEQVIWKHALNSCHQDYGVWHPSDIESGRIDQELSALSCP